MTKALSAGSIVRCLRDEDAQASVEYVLIAAVLILASYGALKMFSAAWRIKFNRLSSVRSGMTGIGP